MRVVALLLMLPSLALAQAGGPAGGEKPRPLAKAPGWDAFSLHGYLRTRATLLHNLDLDRGPTPSGRPIFPLPLDGGQWMPTADARLRLDLGIAVGDVVTARVRIDALDGLVLGSTPEGLPRSRMAPVPWATSRQLPPSDGRNALVDSIRLKEAWAQVLTPIGAIAFGRMEQPAWGLGIVSGRADDVDDDFDDLVDRLSFVTSLKDHLVGVAVDINATGPTSAGQRGGLTGGNQAIDLTFADNLFTVSASMLRTHDEAALRRRRAAGKATFSYGVFGSYRFQRSEIPSFYVTDVTSTQTWDSSDFVQRRMHAVMGDAWLRLVVGPLRVEAEGALAWARVGDPSPQPGVSIDPITALQGGAALEAEVELVGDAARFAFELAWASGDSAPGIGVAPPLDQLRSASGDLDGPQFDLSRGDSTINNFRFHPNHRVDQVFWRTIVGAVSDAVVLRPAIRLRPNPTLDAEIAGVVSLASVPSSTPTGHPLWGGEIDATVRWAPVRGFELRGQYGVFLPGPALNHPTAGWTAQPAQTFRLVLAVLW